jgi:hypothetical protein
MPETLLLLAVAVKRGGTEGTVDNFAYRANQRLANLWSANKIVSTSLRVGTTGAAALHSRLPVSASSPMMNLKIRPAPCRIA